jgi:hypothetical protein
MGLRHRKRPSGDRPRPHFSGGGGQRHQHRAGAEGFAAPNIHYSAQPAEKTNFAARSFDFIGVAQALHWFDYDLYWPEVRRVARPGALFCAWGYAWFRGNPDVEAALLGPVSRLVEPFWASNNRILWNGYRVEDVRFPFEPMAVPEFQMGVNWPTAEIVAYVRTWSAFRRAAAEGHGEELEELIGRAEEQLRELRRHALSVPLTLLAGFVE